MNEQNFAPPSASGTGSGGKQLCLLSLDGGGVRGLSSLQILKQLMELINPRKPPKPCEYFNMIGGTSTGGLIAIMLGRLEMSVDDCIIEYKKLAKDVFTHCKHRLTWRGKVQGRFDHDALVIGICDLLERRGLDQNALLQDPSDAAPCKTFVCTTSKETGETVLLTSYYTERWGMDLLNITKIWEAARATSAATSFFEEMEIDGQTFVDGATGANNPVDEIWTEASFLWRDSDTFRIEDNVKCLVSVGTGMPSLTPFGDGITDVAKILMAIATDTERRGEMFHKQHDNLFRTGAAFRFNVLQGLEHVGLEEADKQGEILACTKRYIAKQHVLDSMKTCAKNLRECENIENLLRESCRDDLTAYTQSSQYWRRDDLTSFTNTIAFRKWESKQAISSMLNIKVSSGSREKNASLAAGIGRRVLCDGEIDILYCALTRDFTAERRAGRNALARVQMAETGEGESEQQKRTQKEDMHDSLLAIWKSLVSQKLLAQMTACASTHNCSNKLAQHEVRRVYDLVVTTHDEHLLLVEFGALLIRMPTIVLFDNIERLPNATFTVLCAQLSSLAIRSDVRSLYCGSGEIPKGVNFETIHDGSEHEECLASLTFEALDRRKAQIAEACEGTTTWLWKHRDYINFARRKSGILWIEGKPGSGKSVLAKSIQQRLSKEHDEDCADGAALSHAPNVSAMAGDFYYHARKGGNYSSHNSCVRSLLHKILRQDRSLFQYFQEDYRGMQPEFAREDWQNKYLYGILKRICAEGTKIICVMDAVDEAENANILDFCQLLVNSPCSQTKFIILSRRNSPIEKALGSKNGHILLEAENGEDLRRIVDAGLSDLQKEMHALHFEGDQPLRRSRRRIPATTSGRCSATTNPYLNSREQAYLDDIRVYLNDNSRNTVLWVKLVLDELKRRVSAGMFNYRELRESLYTMPPELTDYYRSIVNTLTEGADPRNLKRARRALMWVSGAEELSLLHLQELWEALAIPEHNVSGINVDDYYDCLIEDREPINSFNEFRRKLQLMCGPFIEVLRPQDAESQDRADPGQWVVQLMHQTVKDFLNEPGNAGALYFDRSKAIEMVKRDCGRYISLLPQSWAIAFGLPSSELNELASEPPLEAVADWFEERCMIEFAIRTTMLSKPCPDEINMLFQKIIAGSSLGTSEPSAVTDFDRELVDAFTERRYLLNRGPKEVESSMRFARLMRLACSEGMTSAVGNLFTIGRTEEGWWFNQGRLIKDAIAFAASEANSPSYRLAAEKDYTHSPEPAGDITKGDGVWQDTSWQMTCSRFFTTQETRHRTRGIGKETFKSLFSNGWCGYLDKVCGGKFYALEKLRQKERALRTLSFKDNVEQALNRAFREWKAADGSDLAHVTWVPPKKDRVYPYARLPEDQQEVRPRDPSKNSFAEAERSNSSSPVTPDEWPYEQPFPDSDDAMDVLQTWAALRAQMFQEPDNLPTPTVDDGETRGKSSLPPGSKIAEVTKYPGLTYTDSKFIPDPAKLPLHIPPEARELARKIFPTEVPKLP